MHMPGDDSRIHSVVPTRRVTRRTVAMRHIVALPSMHTAATRHIVAPPSMHTAASNYNWFSNRGSSSIQSLSMSMYTACYSVAAKCAR